MNTPQRRAHDEHIKVRSACVKRSPSEKRKKSYIEKVINDRINDRDRDSEGRTRLTNNVPHHIPVKFPGT